MYYKKCRRLQNNKCKNVAKSKVIILNNVAEMEYYETKTAVSESVHQTMIRLFQYYMIVGGMPDAVQRFVDTHDIGQVTEIQKSILELYRQDISKYAMKDKAKIKDIFDSIPSELNEKK